MAAILGAIGTVGGMTTTTTPTVIAATTAATEGGPEAGGVEVVWTTSNRVALHHS